MSQAAAMQIHSFRGASSRAFVCQSGSTLWRSSYSKVSPFALVDVIVTGADLKAGQSPTLAVPRNGDLLANAYVHWKLPKHSGAATDGYIRRVGHALIKQIFISIGNQKLPKFYW